MADFDSVLDAAKQLSGEDLARLVEELNKLAPAGDDSSVNEAWASELAKRVERLKSGSETIPWSTIRAAALADIDHED